jgi:hypothetical protein
MRRETKAIIRTAAVLSCALWPVVALAQEEGPREIELPNPMGAHTWFIIIAVGAFLAWCISYVLQLQKEKLTNQPQRGTLLRQKEELLDRIAELESQKEAGTISAQRYEKEFKKAKGRLSELIRRLARKDSAES